ncbi:MAG: hypothetical protein P3M72_00265 [Candidatus Hodgkinia cicadicola]|nr:MAG: hypothetical protein P3M72_00265 [Candidatus Hodgkinia cicadicola]
MVAIEFEAWLELGSAVANTLERTVCSWPHWKAHRRVALGKLEGIGNAVGGAGFGGDVLASHCCSSGMQMVSPTSLGFGAKLVEVVIWRDCVPKQLFRSRVRQAIKTDASFRLLRRRFFFFFPSLFFWHFETWHNLVLCDKANGADLLQPVWLDALASLAIRFKSTKAWRVASVFAYWTKVVPPAQGFLLFKT